MFLPVLMIRDFGWWAFPVFAIPNCVGAAAMGWVLRRPGASEAVVAAHGRMIRAFSLVTIAFQFAFLYSLMSSAAGGQRLPWIVLAGFAFGIGLGAEAARSSHRSHWGSVATWLFSLAMAAWFLIDREGFPSFPDLPMNRAGLALLAPVCAFGFALSPYLDRTFLLAARDQQGENVPVRFGVGFLVMFPLMIGFTLLYATSLTGQAGEFGSALIVVFSTPVVLHIGAQIGFTFAVHARADTGAPALLDPRRLSWWECGVLSLGFVGVVVAREPKAAEFVYRLFMSFYGLVFPAYVWICMVPTLREAKKPTRRQVTVFSAAVLVAAPFYWLGFIELEYWALGVGVMVPLVARLFVGRVREEALT